MENISFVYLNVYAFFILIILFLVFCSKKRLHKIEDNTYGLLLLFSIITILFGLLLTVIINIDLPFKTLFNIIFNKTYFAGLVIVIFIFSFYTYCISHVDSKKFAVINRLYRISMIVNVIIIYLLPLDVSNVTGNSVIPSGLSMIYTYVVFIIVYCTLTIQVIIDFKNIKNKKYLPIILLILEGFIITLLQIVNPSINFIINPSIVITCLLMYFTIENPDVKVIEELQVARDQAEKANRAKTDFLSSMSHEIRTPLNAIVGFSDCIMDAENLDEAKENAHDIVNASQTLLEIVNGILDISKIEAGKIEIVNSPYNASEVFNELAKLIIPKMNEKGLDFSYNIAPDLPQTLYGDHANLKKVITNLLSNACKYTDRGFVHYEVNCVNSNNVSKLIISVEDSGRGIKKENIDKMFTKFQRLDEDRNTTIEGTGLGLAITKQLVELMGGRIIVHTVYGEGSKFTIVLNQRIENNVIKEEKKVKSTLDLHDVKILLVDDTSLNIKVACKLLEKYNANMIDTCDSGFACIEKIKNGNKYDLILLDDMMPKMSGVITLKRLKEDPNFNIPTIALTANAITGMREKYLADGFNDYLAKPIEKEQLIRVVNQVLGRSATEELDKINTDTKVVSINSEDSGLVTVDTENKDRVIPITDDDINMDEILSSTRPIEVSKEENIESLEDTNNIPEIIDISENNTFDRNYLESNGADINHALELLGDMDMYNMTIHDFFDEVDEKWNRIIEYKNTNNMSDYAIEVHSLKSDCKYLGFMGLADIAYEHELKSKENDSDFVNSNFLKLETEYNRVHEVVKNYVNNNPTE